MNTMTALNTEMLAIFPGTPDHLGRLNTELNGWAWGQLLDLIDQLPGVHVNDCRSYGMLQIWIDSQVEILVYTRNPQARLSKILSKNGRYIVPGGMRLASEGDRDIVIIPKVLDETQRGLSYSELLAELVRIGS